MSRTLNDDFDEDDLPGGPLHLEKGSQVGSGAQSSYADSGSMDFDDDYGDGAAPPAALELDMPKAPGVPDLAFDHAPQSSQAPRSNSSKQPGAQPRPASDPRGAGSSGSLPAMRSGAHPAAPSSSAPGGGMPPAPISDSGVHDAYDAAPESERGVEPAPPPAPAKPTAAAIIAKYPDPPEKVSGAPMYAIRVVRRQLELRTDLESLRRRRSPDVALYEAALRAYDTKTFRLGMAINSAVLAVCTFVFFLPVILRFMRAD